MEAPSLRDDAPIVVTWRCLDCTAEGTVNAYWSTRAGDVDADARRAHTRASQGRCGGLIQQFVDEVHTGQLAMAVA